MKRYFKAFTIVELLIVITVLGILAGIGFVSYGSWRQSTTVTQLKSDLKMAATAMENDRNFNNTYNARISNLANFKASSGVMVSGGSGDGKTFCLEATNGVITYHITNTSEASAGGCS